MLKIIYEGVKTEFISIRDSILKETSKGSEVFTEEGISNLPLPVKNYLLYCGYIGKPKMNSMKAVFKDVKFLFGRKKRTLSIDYTQYNIADRPERIAYIDSSVFGIPFEGLDSYIAGNGSMKGVIAKFFTLFSQTGETMDRASLVTFLSESLIIPSAALKDYITWEEIDSLHAKAAISRNGNFASGIFTFNEKGEMVSFVTDDREAVETDGTSKKVKWSAVFGDYKESDGIKKPTQFQAIWHYEDGDLLYFDGKDVQIKYDPEQFEAI